MRLVGRLELPREFVTGRKNTDYGMLSLDASYEDAREKENCVEKYWVFHLEWILT